MSVILLVAAGIFALAVGAAATLQHLRDSVVYMPRAVTNPQLTAIPSDSNSVMLPNGVWVVTRRTDRALPQIIYSHGNNSTVVDHLMLLSNFPNITLYDYRGYGLSEGQCNEHNTLQDLITVVEFVQQHYGLDSPSRDIVLMGRSLGTNVTLAYLEHCEQNNLEKPMRTVLIHPFLSVCSVVPDSVPFKPVLTELAGNMDRREALRKYVKSPRNRLLAFVSAGDNVTPETAVYDLHSTLEPEEQQRFQIVNLGGTHQCINSTRLWNCTRAFIYGLAVQHTVPDALD